jgi:hypothetical protein
MYLAHYFLAVVEGTERDPEYGKKFVGKHESGYDSSLVEVEESVGLLSSGRMEVRGEKIAWKGGEEVRWEEVNGADGGAMEALMVFKGWEQVLEWRMGAGT